MTIVCAKTATSNVVDVVWYGDDHSEDYIVGIGSYHDLGCYWASNGSACCLASGYRPKRSTCPTLKHYTSTDWILLRSELPFRIGQQRRADANIPLHPSRHCLRHDSGRGPNHYAIPSSLRHHRVLSIHHHTCMFLPPVE